MDQPPIRQGMLFSDLRLLDENPPWRLALQAYYTQMLEAAEARAAERKRAKAAAKQTANHNETVTEEDPAEAEENEPTPFAGNRWLSRIQSVDGVPTDELSCVHGNLIAHGFLKFQLSGRDGLVYQLTSLGRRGAENSEQTAEDFPDDVDDDSLDEAA